MNYSQQQGIEGRIGLHSLIKAEPFYEKMGMTDAGIDISYDDLRYLETTQQQAQAFATGR